MRATYSQVATEGADANEAIVGRESQRVVAHLVGVDRGHELARARCDVDYLLCGAPNVSSTLPMAHTRARGTRTIGTRDGVLAISRTREADERGARRVSERHALEQHRALVILAVLLIVMRTQ